ncbi:Fc.00g015660.m01.CDS01 [Cosmosporella sp. VM-42]
MLTVKQPPTYGYKSVHDLPTPPSTSRPSPPLIYQEHTHKALPVIPRNSPPSQPMSAPHRGLPPPAAMALPPQQPPTTGAPPPAHHAPPPPPPPPSLTQSHQSHQGHQQRDSWGQLPAPPHQWQGAEDSMRNWLQARAEEDKRRQEEEKTRQESLRLEQRKIEMDMLRTSLSGGIPPAMVPLVFAGMGSGGVLPQAALEWAQQFMPPSQTHHPQLMPPQPISPEHQRDQHAQTHGQHYGIPPVQGGPPPAAYAYPGSPTRPRGQTVIGTMGRPMAQISNLPSLNTNIPQPSHGVPSMAHQQMQQAQPGQQESQQSSPSIYFHHWQPPTSQASSSSNRPGTPSGETPRKRKATGQHAPSPTRADTRFRSPPPFVQSSLSNPTRARRGHTRQRSDMSSYREPGRSRRESFGGPLRGLSPIRSSAPGPSQRPSHERGSSERERSESQKHSVSSMLSEEPRPASQHSAPAFTGERSEKRQRQTPPSESQAHGGVGESGPSREGEGPADGAREGM